MKPSFSPPKAESAQIYLDSALSKGAAAAKRVKGGLDRTMKARNSEIERFMTIRNLLLERLQNLHDAYPSFDQLSEFVQHLFELDLELGRVRQALGGVKHAITMIRALTKEHMEGIRHCSSVDEVVKTRSAYLGRVSSVMRQLDKHLEMLNKARDILRNLPSIDDELFTVAIAGFPNVGKSTLLSKITTAKPEIKAYAFTTKGLNVGYFEYKYNKIQCVDTPGTLDRIKPNDIERKADATIKYLAHLVVYVVDPTEGGYSLAQQHQLYDKTDRLGKRMLVYVSKADVMDKATIQSVLDKYPDSTCDPAILRAAIVKAFKEEFV